jgi:DNA repair exonuclease SbcCD ATPase subunit
MNNKNQEEFVSVKEACDMLNCGRTKIYTHYISNGLLAVRRKIGNKSFFYRAEVEKLCESENSFLQKNLSKPLSHGDIYRNTPQTIPENIHHSNQSKTDTFSEPEEESGKMTTIRPVRSNEDQDIIVTDYIKNLKAKIAELEENLNESSRQNDILKARLLNTIPLLEFSEKIKEKDTKLLEYTEVLKKANTELQELGQKFTESEEERECLRENFDQSLELAVTYKSQLDKTEQKQQQIKALHHKLRELQEELENCHFFAWGRKGELKKEIKALISTLSKFE